MALILQVSNFICGLECVCMCNSCFALYICYMFRRFGQNYTVGIRARIEELKSVGDFMTANFSHALLKVRKLELSCEYTQNFYL